MRQRLRLRHLILALISCISSTALADEKPRVLILPYRIDPRVPVDAETCNAILAARMGKLDIFTIVTQDELNAMGNYQAMLQGLGADDDVDALQKLGEAAHADKLISGLIGDVGGTAAATLTLVDVKSAAIEKRIAGTAKGSRDLILPLLNGQADGMLAHLIRTYAPERMHAKAPAPTTTASERPTAKSRVLMIAMPVVIGITAALFGFSVAAVGGGLLSLLTFQPSVPAIVIPAVLLGAGVVTMLATGVGVVSLVVLAVIMRM